MTQSPDKYHFLLRNLLKGLLFFAVFILAFMFLKKGVGAENLQLPDWVMSNPIFVFGVFTLSELLFGIITPEFFMLWGLQYNSNIAYVAIISTLLLISYGAGWLNYWLGRRFRNIAQVRWFISRRMKKSSRYLRQYGDFLVLVAAVTPLPYAATCFLVGSANYRQRNFLIYSLYRIARFALYGAFVWFFLAENK